ncbi:MAG TPA: hypothetical protein VMB50_06205 [Myxococcales bacterium]|nr:hypothetical protein [Myxococcales bacterium]
MAGRNSLYVIHRVLIVSAIVLSVILLVHGLALFFARGDRVSLITGVAAAAVGLALSGYLVRLSRRR